MTHLMEGVINRGTGAGVRARDSSCRRRKDGNFARWLVCRLYKGSAGDRMGGFDDNRDLSLEGARSALRYGRSSC
jgi:hypothetical protein